MKLTKDMKSDFDEFLSEEGILTECEQSAAKRVVAFQIEQLMKEKKITKTKMAQEMKTSRAVVNRLLNPEVKSVTLKTLESAAALFGKRVHIELV